ncbi:MAG: hypothetical protein PHP83_02045 [Clostridia bacterium]|nr:hypothetical protein [Clostridia bacterium]
MKDYNNTKHSNELFPDDQLNYLSRIKDDRKILEKKKWKTKDRSSGYCGKAYDHTIEECVEKATGVIFYSPYILIHDAFSEYYKDFPLPGKILDFVQRAGKLLGGLFLLPFLLIPSSIYFVYNSTLFLSNFIAMKACDKKIKKIDNKLVSLEKEIQIFESSLKIENNQVANQENNIDRLNNQNRDTNIMSTETNNKNINKTNDDEDDHIQVNGDTSEL